jgi:hypothetical protein
LPKHFLKDSIPSITTIIITVIIMMWWELKAGFQIMSLVPFAPHHMATLSLYKEYVLVSIL